MKNMNSYSFMYVNLFSSFIYFPLVQHILFRIIFSFLCISHHLVKILISYNSSSGISVDDRNCIVFQMNDIQDYCALLHNSFFPTHLANQF